MRNEMSRQQVIEELERTQSLIDRIEEKRLEAEALVLERKEAERVVGTAAYGDVRQYEKERMERLKEKIPRFAESAFDFPAAFPKDPADVKDPAKDIIKGVVASALAVAGLIFWLILLITGSQAWGLIILSVILMLVFGAYSVFAMIPVRNIAAWEKACKDWEAEQRLLEKKIDAVVVENAKIFEDFREFDRLYLQTVEECDAYYAEREKKLLEEGNKIRQDIMARYNVIKAQMDALVEQARAVTVIHHELFEHAGAIAKLLKTGRADTLKEAINMALEEARKEEEEQQRRAEALAQEALLERQATENRLYNEAMQRAAEDQARAMREHHAEMERAAREQAKAAELQAQAAAAANKLAQDQARAAQVRARSAEYEAREKCRGCVNSTKCSFAARRNSLSCGAYKPR